MNGLHTDIQDELLIWRLVIDKTISYSDLDKLNFIDALKLNAVLDFKNACEEQQLKESTEE